jgi:hypothetical protein
VTDIHSAKDEIEATPDVGLVFIDPSDKAYLSITGRACFIHDAERIKAAWRKTDEVWWPGGPNDPNVCSLQIEPLTAELWDGPASAFVSVFEFAKADRRRAEPRREPQGDGQDVSAQSAKPTSGATSASLLPPPLRIFLPWI